MGGSLRVFPTFLWFVGGKYAREPSRPVTAVLLFRIEAQERGVRPDALGLQPAQSRGPVRRRAVVEPPKRLLGWAPPNEDAIGLSPRFAM